MVTLHLLVSMSHFQANHYLSFDLKVINNGGRCYSAIAVHGEILGLDLKKKDTTKKNPWFRSLVELAEWLLHRTPELLSRVRSSTRSFSIMYILH